jgi:NAD(P)-dependent dehydrogenase (short-subunit alcohol dehydrogenase family)
MSFKGKVVIVTGKYLNFPKFHQISLSGSSSGIGQEAALLFAEQGASVTIHGQSQERLKVRFFGAFESKIKFILVRTTYFILHQMLIH